MFYRSGISIKRGSAPIMKLINVITSDLTVTNVVISDLKSIEPDAM